MEKLAERILNFFRIHKCGRQRTADDLVEDERMRLKIVARLRTECSKFRITEDISRTDCEAA
jgi:hypothetical protein